MKREPKPVTITKRQLDAALAAIFDIEEARLRLPTQVYEYAWTVWASRQTNLNQGARADRRAKRKTVVLP